MATRKKKKTTKRAPARDHRITEEQHNEAVNVLRAEYYQSVRGIAEELTQRAKDKEIHDQDGWEQAIHEAIDSSHWVIYTHANFQVLMCSDNHDAYSEEYGQPAVEGDSINWAALAFAAMEMDLRVLFNASASFSVPNWDEPEEELEAPRRRTSKRAPAHRSRRR